MLNFLYCCDENYNLQFQTSVFSLLENISENINIYVIHKSGFNKESISEKITKHIKIIKIPLRRGPFKEATIHYEDIRPTFTEKTNKNKYIKKISSGRRPTKSNRRKLDKFTGRNF